MAQKIVDRKTLNILGQYVKLLKKRGLPLEKVILFGSQARGNAKRYSDVDILVVVKRLDPKIRNIIIDEAFNLSIEENIDIIALPCVLEEYNSPLFQADHFYQNIKKEGVVIVT
jgi:predicted nucleotidyltransferase